MEENKDLKMELYKDFAQPAVRKVGETIGDLTDVLLSPFNLVVWGFDRFKGWITKKVHPLLESYPEDKLVSPDPLIAGPIFENVRYAENHEHIQEMYATLLAKSMHIDYKEQVFPSFVDIVRQLIPLDTIVLNELNSDRSKTLIADFRFILKNGKKGEYAEPVKKLSIITIEGYDREKITTSIENLERLKLIELDPNPKTPLTLYDSFKNMKEYILYDNYLKTNTKHQFLPDIKINTYSIDITNFGEQFLNIISKD